MSSTRVDEKQRWLNVIASGKGSIASAVFRVREMIWFEENIQTWGDLGELLEAFCKGLSRHRLGEGGYVYLEPVLTDLLSSIAVIAKVEPKTTLDLSCPEVIQLLEVFESHHERLMSIQPFETEVDSD